MAESEYSKYSENKKARIRAASLRWYRANTQAAKTRKKKWYAANKEKNHKDVRAWRIKNPHAGAMVMWKRRGLPKPTRDRPKTCECCGKHPTKNALALDHCHQTGLFRGWLCVKCNTGIGNLGDDEAGLERALAYLRKQI